MNPIIVGKFGGGVLRTPADVCRLPEIVRNYNIKVLVVSAFFGQTQILRKICDERTNALFYSRFVPFHCEFYIKLFDSSRELFVRGFEDLIAEFNTALDLLVTSSDPVSAQRARARVLALGEDFSSRMVYLYLRRTEGDFRKVDARDVIKTKPGSFVDAEIDELETTARIASILKFDESTQYIIQGFVASSQGVNGAAATTVLPFDGSDLTAAVITSVFYGAGTDTQLVYFKRAEGERMQKMLGIGIGKLFTEMKERGTVIVSPSIIMVKNFPPSFLIADYDNPAFDMWVIADELMLKRLRLAQMKETDQLL